MIGRILGQFRIVEKLGEGGMGVVYKAEDTVLKRNVALKMLSSGVADDPDRNRRFLREARAAAALHHPVICPVHSFEEHEECFFIVMAFIEGQTLRTRLKAEPLSLEHTLSLAFQLADGLSAAHDKGVVHRDIKPANIMVPHPGKPVITDFGLAFLEDTRRLTRGPTTQGTAAYMSPEQAQALPVDHRTDLWSLGVVIQEMLTGKLPFSGDRSEVLIHSIISTPPRPLTGLPENTVRVLGPVLDHTLAKLPENRYSDARELLIDLKRAAEELNIPLAVSNEYGPPTVVMSRPRKKANPGYRQKLWAAVLLIALATVFLGVKFPGFYSNSISEEKTVPNNVVSVQTGGRISDTRGRPIVFATITVDGYDVEGVSKSDGSFLFMLEEVGPAEIVTIRVRHPEFVSYSRDLSAGEELRSLEIELKTRNSSP